MVRTSLLALVLGVVGVVTVGGAPAPLVSSEGTFRIYTKAEDGTRVLRGTYPSLGTAIDAANRARLELRQAVEVATGPRPPREGLPVAYHVYTRRCSKSPWARTATFHHLSRAASLVEGLAKQGELAEWVIDTSEFYRVFAGASSRSLGLRGTYLSAGDAIEAAAVLRAKTKGLHCRVTSGPVEAPARARPVDYQVYIRPGRIGWSLVTTTNDAGKAEEIAQGYRLDGTAVEVVHRFVAK